jgi:arsenate reductase
MAEALVNHDLAGRWMAFSAGTAPTGYVHPLALKALAEIGILHQGNSKSVDVFRSEVFDLVITVCDDAAENCPVWLGKGRKEHISFPDPGKAEGSQAEKMVVFRHVRDAMRARILAALEAFSVKEK